jgi:hypothetical protein
MELGCWTTPLSESAHLHHLPLVLVLTERATLPGVNEASVPKEPILKKEQCVFMKKGLKYK